MDTLTALAFRARADRHRFDDRPRGGGGRWLAARLRGARLPRRRAAGRRWPVQRLRHARRAGRGALDALRLCAAVLSRAAIADGKLFGRGACDAKGILAAQVAAAERLRAAGQRRVGLLFVVGEERGSEGATAANRSPPGSGFLVNGEPTDSRLATGTRGILRVRLHARGRAGHSSAPEHFESAIEKLVDALVQLRDCRCRRTSLRRDLLQRRADRRRRRAQRRAGGCVRRSDVPDRRRCGRGPCGGAGRWSRWWRSRRSCGCRRSICTPCRGSRRGVFPSRPTSRCSIAGGFRCCSVRDRSWSRTPTTSISCRIRGEIRSSRDRAAPTVTASSAASFIELATDRS